MTFPKETFAFLKGIKAHNEKAWFEAHRDLYEAGYIAPSRGFVETLGGKLRKISPGVKFEPKVNGSMSRINRDIRFSKDKRPYKDHLDLWFWHGDKKSWDQPGFWFRMTSDQVQLGVGLYQFMGEALESFRQSVIHPRSGKALTAAIAAVEKKGPYEIGGKTRKRLPRGYEAEADRQDYLLYEGLYTSITLPIETASKADFADACAKHYANCWPMGKWLIDEVAA